MTQYLPSKWMIQACPPDMTESRVDARWAFGLYEVLDSRKSPMEPRVLHSVYRGAVELRETELPPADDPYFSAKLEEAVVAKWKSLVF